MRNIDWKEFAKGCGLAALALAGTLIVISLVSGCATAGKPTCESVMTAWDTEHAAQHHKLVSAGQIAPGSVIGVYADAGTHQWAMLIGRTGGLVPSDDDPRWKFTTRCTLPDGDTAKIYQMDGEVEITEHENANHAKGEFN